MAESVIRWKQGDYIRLGRAVADFNKKINRLQSEENKLYLPEEQNYYNVKSRIYSRRELNRVINSLRRFTVEGAEDLIENEIGNLETKWSIKEKQLQTRIAVRNLNKQISEFTSPTKNGFSKVQMGDLDYLGLEATKTNITSLDKLEGESYKRARRRIKELGTEDYLIYKAQIYRENILENFEGLLNSESGRLLYNKLKSIKNPLNFVDFIKRSEAMQDFFVWYQEGEGIQYRCL